MKLSQRTLSILRNFSEIVENKGIVLKPGNFQSAISDNESLVVEVTLDEEIPVEFGIYELKKFISNLKYLGDDCDVTFDENNAYLKFQNFMLTYRGSAVSLIATPRGKVKMNDFDVEMSLPQETLKNAKDLALMNGLDAISFIGTDDGLYIKIFNRTDKDSGKGQFYLGENSTGKKFESRFLLSDLRLMQMDYLVRIKFDEIACFMNDERGIRYYIGLEAE